MVQDRTSGQFAPRLYPRNTVGEVSGPVRPHRAVAGVIEASCPENAVALRAGPRPEGIGRGRAQNVQVVEAAMSTAILVVGVAKPPRSSGAPTAFCLALFQYESLLVVLLPNPRNPHDRARVLHGADSTHVSRLSKVDAGAFRLVEPAVHFVEQ